MTTYGDVLKTVDTARSRTRRAKRAGWIPLLVFGIVVMPAMIFHEQHRSYTAYDGSGRTRIVHIADPTGGPGLFSYWQVAIPLGYALVAVLYAVRNRRAGVRSPVKVYLVTGIVLTVALHYLAKNAVATLGWSNFGIHGMEQTITIGMALFVLAWIERSTALLVAAAAVTGVAVAASQYDIENLWDQLFSWYPPEWLLNITNDLALCATLFLAAAIVAVVDRRHARPGRAA